MKECKVVGGLIRHSSPALGETQVLLFRVRSLCSLITMIKELLLITIRQMMFQIFLKENWKCLVHPSAAYQTRRKKAAPWTIALICHPSRSAGMIINLKAPFAEPQKTNDIYHSHQTRHPPLQRKMLSFNHMSCNKERQKQDMIKSGRRWRNKKRKICWTKRRKSHRRDKIKVVITFWDLWLIIWRLEQPRIII